MTTSNKPNPPADDTKAPRPGTDASDRSGGYPVPAPDGVDQHNEDPRDRAIRLGQGDVVDPAVATGQNPEQMRDELVRADSNEQLRIAAEKRAAAEVISSGGTARDERGFVER
jgi:hypothetical protein